MKTAPALMFFAFTASAQAGWQIQSVNDRLTGRQINVAVLDAKSRDNDISATLELSCVNGARSFAIRISTYLTRGRLPAAYRIDEGSPDSSMSFPTPRASRLSLRRHSISSARNDFASN